jgi:hypothetical protein
MDHFYDPLRSEGVCDGGGDWWLPEITWLFRNVVCVLLILESTQFVWETGRLEENEPSSGHPHGVHKQGLKPP